MKSYVIERDTWTLSKKSVLGNGDGLAHSLEKEHHSAGALVEPTWKKMQGRAMERECEKRT